MKASASVAAVLFGLIAGGWWTGQEVLANSAMREHFDTAERALAAGDLTTALEAVARAEERVPDAPEAVVLRARIEQADREARRADDLAAAAMARQEASAKFAEYAELQLRLAPLERAVETKRAEVWSKFANDADRAEFAKLERDLQAERERTERLFIEAEQDLQRAARLEAPWGGSTPATDAAIAAMYMRRWRQAIADGDAVLAALWRSSVERHDSGGVHREELLGRGRVSVTVDARDAEVFLFRYEPFETVRDDHPLPRLVPVPTAGIGRLRDGAWLEGFHPGDVCLRITAVEPDSLAAELGLRRGDLIVQLGGELVGHRLYATGDRAGDAIDSVDVTLPVPIDSLNDRPVHDRADFAFAPRGAGTDRLRLAGLDQVIECSRRDVEVHDAVQLAEADEAPMDLEWTALRGGELVEVSVAAGQSIGVRCEFTAYPLICAAGNRIGTDVEFETDPGSYLLAVRADGYEEQRVPFVVPRLGEAHPEVQLLEAGSVPPGFVHVPAGPFVCGGDPRAQDALAAATIELDSFFIGRTEVTNADWFEFVNDPATLEKIEALNRNGTSLRYLPRDNANRLFRKLAHGYSHYEQYGTSPASPVFGVSWADVQEFVEWRNRRAEAAGEPWIYSLPTELEWEKAARGVDGRAFPWGNRFDYSLTIGLHHKWSFRYPIGLPGGWEPRDESPYGVRDMAGSREEWTADVHTDGALGERVFFKHGGCFLDGAVDHYRAATRLYSAENYATGRIGLRLVARRRQ